MRLASQARLVSLGAAVLAVLLAAGASADVLPIAHVGSHQGLLQGPEQALTTAGTARATAPAATVKRRRIGTSVQHRPIYAYRLGDPTATVKAVVRGEMHGDEPAGVELARALVRGAPILGIELWVVPTMNPDGLAAGTRQNAHGVDLNRNWAYKWVHQTGTYNSGPRPFSEPETRAMQRFLNKTDPNFVVSFHQPLHAVDSYQVKNTYLMNRLARNLKLPENSLDCDGICHGTMTGWFNYHHAGAAITVEFGSAPSYAYLTHGAVTGTMRSLLGHY